MRKYLVVFVSLTRSSSCIVNGRFGVGLGVSSGQPSLLLALGLFRRRNVGLDVAVVQVLVGLCPDVLDDVADAQRQLVLDGRHPRVHVQLEDRSGAHKVQLAELWWQNRQAVALQMKFSQIRQLANFLFLIRFLKSRFKPDY